MDLLPWIIGGTLVAFVLLLLVLGIIAHVHDRMLVPDYYEWLEVCSYNEWKTGPELRKEMARRKKTRYAFGSIFYTDIVELEEEKLVVCRWREADDLNAARRCEYLRVANGKRRPPKRDDDRKEVLVPGYLRPV